FLAQQHTVQSPLSQQFIYYQMTQRMPSNLSSSPYQNQAANVKTSQIPPELALPHSSECEVHLFNERHSERMRKWLNCDNDISTEDNKRRQKEDGQNHKEC
ncbi:hypothetical protein N305_05703, partial [Manacus vitellinus]